MLIGLLWFTSLLDDHKPYDTGMGMMGLFPLSAQAHVELAF